MRFDFKLERDKIIVEPVITGNGNRRKFRFFLDTGAGVTVIDYVCRRASWNGFPKTIQTFEY